MTEERERTRPRRRDHYIKKQTQLSLMSILFDTHWGLFYTFSKYVLWCWKLCPDQVVYS